MKNPVRDAALRSALLRAQPRHSICDVDAIAQRVKKSAGPALLRRRHRALSAAEYIGRWTDVLMPFGLVLAVAGIAVLVFPRAATEQAARAALLSAATNRISAPELVDIILLPAE